MFLSYLACSLQKYNNPETFADSAKNKKLTCVFLDKDRGAELCIRMLGGEYYTVKAVSRQDGILLLWRQQSVTVFCQATNGDSVYQKW